MSAINERPKGRQTGLEAALASALTPGREAPPRLWEAIRFAVFPGGARIRPNLCLAVAGADRCAAPEVALGTACALELLHCASLVHDDLPCFDDADLRRGKPSVHRAYGQPLAVLAGDALIVAAFEIAAAGASRQPQLLPGLIRGLSTAAGASRGLIAGQGWESEPSIALDAYHRAKTGSLFVAATTLGAYAAGRDPEPWRAVGEHLGAAYQVADDLLDAHASSQLEGKPTGRDFALGRPSAVATHGTAGAVDRLRHLVDEAAAAVPPCPGAAGIRRMVVQMAERLVPPSLRQTAA